MIGRWWTYQKERFPVLVNAPLIAVFSFSAISFSALLRGPDIMPGGFQYLVAFLSSFIFFFNLRVADEFKDFEEDARFRPYRPVPRGLVTLKELGVVGIAGGIIQLALSLTLNPRPTILLFVVWFYFGLMGREFFIRNWLKKQPMVYMLSHMMIMPLIAMYATACDWMTAGILPPSGLFWFLALSFFNGMVIEIGRKIRAPEDEETGVETYSSLWGRQKAALAWLSALFLAGICAVFAADIINFVIPVMIILALLLVSAFVISLGFIRLPCKRRAVFFEPHSALWTLLIYISLGIAPMVLRRFL